MNLSAPNIALFVISVVVAGLAVVAVFVQIEFVSKYAFWVAILAYVVLAIGCLLKK